MTQFCWLSSLVLLLALALGVGEIFWLAFVVSWAAAWSWRLAPRWFCCLPLLAGAGILVAHQNGEKLYGSPRLTDNRPLLTGAFEAARLEAPNVIVATDGSKHTLRDRTFKPAFIALLPLEQKRILDHLGGPLRFLPDTKMPSGYVAESRLRYFCGNTWFPLFFPRRLPSHTQRDLGDALEGWTIKADQ